MRPGCGARREPRAVFTLPAPTDVRAVQGLWRCAPGVSPGEPKDGLVSQAVVRHARRPDATEAPWDVGPDLTAGPFQGGTFGWDRLTTPLPDTMQGRDRRGARLVFETGLDDAGESWITGTCDRQRGPVQGVPALPRILGPIDPHPGPLTTLAWLAVTGHVGAPPGRGRHRWMAERTAAIAR
jgi:hypothetical protein